MLSHEHVLTVLTTQRHDDLRRSWQHAHPESRERRPRPRHRFPRFRH